MRCRLILLTLFLIAPIFAETWQIARPDYAWSFPQDHWARHGYKTEWWYFTGHLKTQAGRRFGYQFTIFRVGLLSEKPALDSAWATRELCMGHAAVSDLSQKQHYFSEVLFRTTPLLAEFGTFPDTLIAWSRGPTGTKQQWKLRWNGAAFDFEMADREQNTGFALHTHPQKPLVFQGPNGYSRKGADKSKASQYYSFTRLATTGTLTVQNETFAVTGQSWMDKEFGSNQLADHQTGWDWFSLQLDSGREVMLYVMRNKTGGVDFARGTLVSNNGKTAYLTAEDFNTETTVWWTSPHTGARYPAGWTVGVGSETWTVRPVMADQENRGKRVETLFYWEGAVDVLDANGEEIGKGYVELTGYGTGSKPGI